MRPERDRVVIHLTDTDCVVRKPGQSCPLVARVLGREHTAAGETVWLDRCVHRKSDPPIDGWVAHGAVSTILVRTKATLEP